MSRRVVVCANGEPPRSNRALSHVRSGEIAACVDRAAGRRGHDVSKRPDLRLSEFIGPHYREFIVVTSWNEGAEIHRIVDHAIVAVVRDEARQTFNVVDRLGLGR